MKSSQPSFGRELRDSEWRFNAAMERLYFGRFESLRVQRGELVLDPWPKTIQGVRFGTDSSSIQRDGGEIRLKPQVSQFFAYIRGVESGTISLLEVRHGLPFVMEIEQEGGIRG